jgi:hypothetical protein
VEVAEDDVRTRLRRMMVKKEVGVEKGEEPGSSRPPECQRGQTETS